MNADQEAALRQRIQDAQMMAAYHARKGNNTGRPDDPRWHFELARELAADAKSLQHLLADAGLPLEPDRSQWDFRWP